MNHDALRDALTYVVYTNRSRWPLSIVRLAHIIYLADWHATVRRGFPVTSLSWALEVHGPIDSDFIEVLHEHPDIIIDTEHIDASRTLTICKPRHKRAVIRFLSEEDIAYLEHEVEVARDLSFADLSQVVKSTYPVATAQSGDELNLTSSNRKRKKSQSHRAQLAGTV